MYVKISKASKILGIHPQTLRRWDKDGKLKTIRSPSGQRLIDVSEFLEQSQRVICYARVSSGKQKEDLERQSNYLQEKYPKSEIIQDVGSGINFKRKGLLKLIDLVAERKVKTIVVAHKDRLCRFAFDLLEQLFKKYGTQILVLDEVNCSPQEELTKDLTTIIHVFSCRLHGLKKYSKKVKKDKDLPQFGTKENS
jgi:predicted site-specific integrase-resolvase